MGASSRQHIGVCLSGGGHRASLFGLGALLYLIDAGKGGEISAISSVSGGSLTNAWISIHTDLTTVSPSDFRGHVRTLAKRIALRGTVWASMLTYVLLIAIAVPVAGALAVSLVWGTPAAYLAWPVASLLAGIIAQRRSWVARRSFEHALFDGRTLEAMHHGVDHIICSTDLQTGEPVYFSGRFIYSWRTGFGDTAGLHLAAAAQASAALPGAFPPVGMGTERHHFAKTAPFRKFVLTDGGVYDNMGTEWVLRVTSGFDVDSEVPTPPPNPIDEAVVINASAAKGVVSRARLRVPVLGELLTLLAVKDVLYDQTTAVRRRLLNLRYRIAARAPQLVGDGLLGATIQIDRSPFDLADNFIKGRDHLAMRARAVRTALGEDERAAWTAAALANRKVRTKLSKIPKADAARLLRHAYVLTMADTHVLLGYPLLPMPTVAASLGWLT